MKNKLTYWLLALITLVGFLVRIWNITTNPPELFNDEITGFLSAKNIVETGKDINGKSGLYFYNRLELYPPVYGYLTYFTSILIKNDVLAIRLPAVISGTLAIVAIYFLSNILFKKRVISLFAAIFYAFTPWSIHFGRVGWSPALLILFLITSIILFKLFIDKKKVLFLYASCFLFALSIYSYRALEFLAPFFLITLTLCYWKDTKRYFKNLAIGFSIFFLLTTPRIYTSLNNPLMNERAERISTFSKGITKNSIGIFINNYFSHFGPQFLFISGDPNPRQNAGTGEIYWIMLPLIIIGLTHVLKNIFRAESKLLLIWFFVYPLGGSLTNDGVPHATRTLIGIPLFAILSAMGFYYFWSFLKKRIYKDLFVAVFFIFFTGELLIFIKNYFVNYPVKSQVWWDYGTRKVLLSIKNNTTGDESLCLPNIEYWHEDTYPNYYFGVGNKYRMVFDLNNPACLKSDILVLKPETKTQSKYIKTDVIKNLEGVPIWLIYKRII